MAARRRITDRLRAEAVANRKLPLLAVDADLTEEAQRTMADPGEHGGVADERLRLVLLCAHPALPPEAAAALTLRLVLGVSTEDLARLFLVRTSTMAARLTRARKRLAGESFAVPVGAELADRVRVVSDVAYLAFTAGYAPGSGSDVLRADVAGEAIRLVRVLRDLLPEPEPEVDALLALMLLQHSRRDARVDDGRLVLLPDQDRRLWVGAEITEAVQLLTPVTHAAPAPYLLQALVAAEHAIAATAADTDWSRIVARYDELLGLVDSPVVRLNRAVAVGEADGPLAGLAALGRAHRRGAAGPPTAGRAGRAAGPGRAARRGAGRLRRRDRAVRQRGRARPSRGTARRAASRVTAHRGQCPHAPLRRPGAAARRARPASRSWRPACTRSPSRSRSRSPRRPTSPAATGRHAASSGKRFGRRAPRSSAPAHGARTQRRPRNPPGRCWTWCHHSGCTCRSSSSATLRSMTPPS